MEIVSSQVVVVAIAVVALILSLVFLKKIAKLVVSILILVGGGIAFGVLTPKQVFDTASLIKDKGIATYEKFAEVSDKIKVSGDSISIKVGDTWFDLNSVNSFDINGDEVRLSIGGNDYTINDKTVADLFETLKSA